MEKIPLKPAQYNRAVKHAIAMAKRNNIPRDNDAALDHYVKTTLYAELVGYCRDNYGFWVVSDQIDKIISMFREQYTAQN